jgi:DNA-binding transcriptional MerR regulator
VTDRLSVSIGDVLNQLRDDFPDVTISKIRFLESQGLLVPERTASGYRKFSPDDIARLRWILRQQREHFLPLKVIKERLEEVGPGGGLPPEGDAVAAATPALFDSASSEGEARPAASPALQRTRPSRQKTKTAKQAAAPPEVEEPTALADVPISDDGAGDELAAGATSLSMTRSELARAAELTEDELVELEEYGLVMPAHRSRDRVLFDEDALEVARVSAAFMRHGVEPRHLRMYRAFADREATLFEQVLLPFRRRRNPAAQERGEATLRELAQLGRRLRTAMLRQVVRRSGGM